MFERFNDRARRVVALSQEYARLGAQSIGLTHVLLGVLHEGATVAAKVLIENDVTHDFVMSTMVTHDTPSPSGHMPFSPAVKLVFERATREALTLGHSYIGVEHITLALCHDKLADERAAEGLGWLDASIIRELLLAAIDAHSDPFTSALAEFDRKVARANTMYNAAINQARSDLREAIFAAREEPRP